MLALIFNSMLLLIPIIRREKEELFPAQHLCGPSPSKGAWISTADGYDWGRRHCSSRHVVIHSFVKCFECYGFIEKMMELQIGFLPQVGIPPAQHCSCSIELRWYCATKAGSGMCFSLPSLQRKADGIGKGNYLTCFWPWRCSAGPTFHLTAVTIYGI